MSSRRSDGTRGACKMTVAAGLAVGLTAGMGVLSAGMALGQPASFGIDNEGKYTQFKASVRAAEYVREDYILGSVPVVNGAGVVVDEVEIGSKPRVIGVLAATMAFVERNPSAETAAISAFTAAMDDVLSSRFHSDPDLTRPENFLAALRFGRVLGVSGDPSLDPLIGFDTDINDRAFELLGLDLPEATSRPQMERRVRAHEAATAVNLGTSLEFGELLVRAFMNQGPEGGYLTGSLSSTMSAYLLANGYNPASGDVRPEHTGVNAAMAALPTSFAQLQNELMQPFVVLERLPGETEAQYRSRQAPSALQNRMRTAVYEVLDVTDQAIGEIGPEVTFDESNFLSPAEREAILAEMRASIRATSGPRTSVLANSFLLYNDIQQPAELVFEAQETGSSIIGVSNAVSTGVAGAKLGVAASKLRTALAGGNAAGAVGPFITTADGLIKLLGISEGNVLGGRTTGDVYNQIVSLQSQLADMEVRIDGRFDRIDSKLDALFTTLNDQYEAVLDLTATVDFAVNELLDQSNAIRRLDDTVRAMGRDELNQFFDIGVNNYLGTRQNNADLPWIGGFDTAMNLFFTSATSTAKGTAFVGNAGSPFVLSDADEVLGEGSVTGRLAELLTFSAPFLDSTAGLDAGIVGPEPWALASTAYAQLADESPWYFAKWLENQASGPRDIDEIISEGEALAASIDVLRQTGFYGFFDENDEPAEEYTLFVSLIGEYQSAAFALQNEINAEVERVLANDFATPLSNGTITLDLWADNFDQNVEPLVGDINQIETAWGGSSTNLNVGDAVFPFFAKGYQYLAADYVPRPAGYLWSDFIRGAQTRSLVRQARGEGVRSIHWYNQNAGGGAFDIVFELTLDSSEPGGAYDIRRRMRYRRELDFFNNGGWISNPPSDVGQAGNIFLGLQADGNTVFKFRWDNSIGLPGIDSPAYTYSATGGTAMSRIRFTSDVTEENPAAVALYQEDLRWVRSRVRDAIRDKLHTPSSPIAQAAEALDDIEAVIDAYVALVRPSLLENSTIARSILRGSTGLDADGTPVDPTEVGLRSEIVLDLLDRFEAADVDDWGNRPYDISNISSQLVFNSELLREELANATDLPDESSPYFLWNLELLKDLRDNASRLAADDRYGSHRDGLVMSVLDNDTRQLRAQDVVNGQVVQQFRPIEVDLSFGPGDAGYVAPSHGSVVFREDGTFEYTPDSGYLGEDRFTYRALCDITADANGQNGGTIAEASPAWVVVNVTEVDDVCLPDINDDGVLNGADFNAWLTAFGAGDLAADQNGDGVLNGADFNAWLTNYAAGCP